jgi:hypothetical protein
MARPVFFDAMAIPKKARVPNSMAGFVRPPAASKVLRQDQRTPGGAEECHRPIGKSRRKIEMQKYSMIDANLRRV